MEVLDEYDHLLYAAHRKAVKKWVVDYDIRPAHTIGDTVTAKHGEGQAVGQITKIEADTAQYVIRREGDGLGCGAVVNYEDVLADALEGTV